MKKLLALIFVFGFFNIAMAQISPLGGLNNISFPFLTMEAMADYWHQYRSPVQPIIPSVSPAASALYMSRTAPLSICTSSHIAHCKTGERQKRADGTWDDEKSKDGTIPPRKSFCFEVADTQGLRYNPNQPCQGNRDSCVPLKTFCRIGTPTPVPAPIPPKPKPKPIPSRCGIFTNRFVCEAAQCQWEDTYCPSGPVERMCRPGICRDPDPYQPIGCKASDISCTNDSDCHNTPETQVCQDIGPLAGNRVCTNGSNQCQRRCLSSSSRIATPIGDISVTDLRVGDIVWTTDAAGNRVVRPLIKVSRVPAPNHRVVHFVLADGRSLDVSALHPAVGGMTVGDLKAGDAYDGSVVKSAELKPYEGTATYDILPAGDTGYYWANGILMGSTLK